MPSPRLDHAEAMATSRSSLCVSLISVLLIATACQAQPVIRLGFLLPYPEGDSAVPERLADEWISTVRVAMEVLGPKYEDAFIIEPFVQNSGCNASTAAEAARKLVDTDVVGVVGPACSEAVAGANSVLKAAGVPFVSFAATANEFATADYPTFFRTVYADHNQARALLNVIGYFNFKKVYVFYSGETYGRSLSGTLKRALGAAATMIEIKYPASTDPKDFEPFFDGVKHDEGSICVFVTLPNIAEGLWKAAYNLNKTGYPWWYLGSDGAVAFDLVGGEGEELAHLAHALQGEIGVAPYKGNYNPRNSPFVEFMDFWKEKPHEQYPGLLTQDASPRYSEARAYVTNLIDSIWAFYEAFNHIVTVSKDDVTSQNVLDCFQDKPAGCIGFDGASGTMAFNATTGERAASVEAPEYGFYNLIDLTWKEKSKWVIGQQNINPDLQYVLRPGPLPEDWRQKLKQQMEAPQAIIPKMSAIQDSEYNNIPAPKNTHSSSNSESSSSPGGWSKGANTGAIIGVVLVSVLIVGFVGYGGWFLYKRYKRHPEHQQFVRML